MEGHRHLSRGDVDGGRHIDEIAKDVAGLGVAVAAHATGEQAIESAGDHQQRHIEVDFESHRRGEGVHVEEADGIRERVLDQHPAGVAGDELLDRGPQVVGQENRRLFMAEIEDVDLPERAPGEADLLVVDARRCGWARPGQRSARHSAGAARSP